MKEVQTRNESRIILQLTLFSVTRVTIVTCNVFSHHTTQDVSWTACSGAMTGETLQETHWVTPSRTLHCSSSLQHCRACSKLQPAAGSRERAAWEPLKSPNALWAKIITHLTSCSWLKQPFSGSSSVLLLWLDFFEWLQNKSEQKTVAMGWSHCDNVLGNVDG